MDSGEQLSVYRLLSARPITMPTRSLSGASASMSGSQR